MRRFAVKTSAIFIFFVLSSAALAKGPDCLMCHPEKSEGKSVHPAVGMGCTVCHIGVDASDIPHKFFGATKGLPANGAQLCFGCHEKSLFTKGISVHMPVADGLCTTCHDPHTSKQESLLLSVDICFNCHDRAGLRGKKHIHSPVSMGMCVSCHGSHTSMNAKLLKSKAPVLCYGCHGKKGFSGPVAHLPVTLGMCDTCHEPHHSDHARLTRAGSTELCLTCHEKADITKKAVHKTGGACLQCHRPHAGSNNFLLK